MKLIVLLLFYICKITLSYNYCHLTKLQSISHLGKNINFIDHQPEVSISLREKRIYSNREGSDESPSSISNSFQRITDASKVVWEFSRPHTLVGSGLSVLSLYLYSVPKILWKSPLFISSLLSTLVPALLTNLYITGLNQITDIEIDRVNKPYLPIVAGKLSKNQAITLVSVAMLLASALVIKSTWPLKLTVFGSALLGTIYSLPPFRLKRFPLLAAFCILVVRGSLVNLGFILQAKMDVLGHTYTSYLNSMMNNPDGIMITTFFAIFGVVIALMKDVPDVQGDIDNNIRTFSVRRGASSMFRISFQLLKLLLGSASVGLFASAFRQNQLLPERLSSLLSLLHLGRLFTGAFAAFLAYDVDRRAKLVEANNSNSVFDYYMHVWKIFYFCYVLLPLTN